MRRVLLIGLATLLCVTAASPQCITSSVVQDGLIVLKPRLGPDGALWILIGRITETSSVVGVGRIDANGSIKMYPVSGTPHPVDLAFDAGGMIWFTDTKNSAIVQFSPSLGVLQQVYVTQGGVPEQIVRGPDDNLWFTEMAAGKIGRLSPSTGQLMEFTIPNGVSPLGIAVGPDGNMWFTAPYAGVGKVTPSGAITLFSGDSSLPYRIATGPDGNLWYTERNGSSVVRVTTAGVSTVFKVIPDGRILSDITAGPDGRMWFVGEGAGVGSITTQGAVSLLPGSYYATNITAGSDGSLWFTSANDSTSVYSLNKINLAEPSGPPTISAVTPNFGPSVGNSSVEIDGSNFQSKATVSFGGTQASSVTFNSPAILAATTPPHAVGLVDVAVTNCDGKAATLTKGFSYDCQSPVVTQQPLGNSIKAGDSATLKVVATGTTPLTYQWFIGAAGDPSSQAVPSATSDVLTVSPTATTSYWVRVTNACGSATSVAAIVSICQPPIITVQPTSQSVGRGRSATLSVQLNGSAPFSYQWYEGVTGDASRPVNGATSSTFTSPPLAAITSFWVRVANNCGAVQSATATISVVSRRRAVPH